jgi:hypothetical protein
MQSIQVAPLVHDLSQGPAVVKVDPGNCPARLLRHGQRDASSLLRASIEGQAKRLLDH